MRKLTTRSIVGGLAVAAFALPSTADAARTCSAPDYPGDGYFAQLRATGTSCSNAKKVARSHYRCRVGNGGRDGRCPTSRRVSGYRCRERNRQEISTQLNAKVICKRGTRRVTFIYQQNL